MTMTGTTTNSISSVAVMIRLRCSRPTWPVGLSKVMLQPPSNNVPSSGNKPSSLGYLFLLISRPLKQLAQCSWVLIANTSPCQGLAFSWIE
jgi:hypothetical protein